MDVAIDMDAPAVLREMISSLNEAGKIAGDWEGIE